jgi:hypothetical protein
MSAAAGRGYALVLILSNYQKLTKAPVLDQNLSQPDLTTQKPTRRRALMKTFCFGVS